jgi:hypothetical protein
LRVVADIPIGDWPAADDAPLASAAAGASSCADAN